MRLKRMFRELIQFARGNVLLKLPVPGIRIKARIPGAKMRKLLRRKLGYLHFNLFDFAHVSSLSDRQRSILMRSFRLGKVALTRRLVLVHLRQADFIGNVKILA